jgi:hypothetical protein
MSAAGMRRCTNPSGVVDGGEGLTVVAGNKVRWPGGRLTPAMPPALTVLTVV